MKNKKTLNDAFTLIEILIVLSIIGLLTGTAIYTMRDKLSFGKEVRVKADIRTIESMIASYQLKFNTLPNSLEDLVDENIMKKIVIDPWNNPYEIAVPGSNGDEYDIYSSGADGIPGNDDDIGTFTF